MLSKAFCEMKDFSSSAFCWLRFFSAHTSCAFAAARSASRAATLAPTSVRSIFASTWPCFTLSPSRTVTATSSPATLAFTVASVSGIREPVIGSDCSSEPGSTMTRSFCRNSATGAAAGCCSARLPRMAA